MVDDPGRFNHDANHRAFRNTLDQIFRATQIDIDVTSQLVRGADVRVAPFLPSRDLEKEKSLWLMEETLWLIESHARLSTPRAGDVPVTL